MGNTKLDRDNLTGYEDVFRSWTDSLESNADELRRSFQDVEGNAASIMRQFDLPSGTVVINNEAGPCFNCVDALPKILNPGQILEVIWSPDGGNTFFVDVFRGGKPFNLQTDRQRLPLDF